MLYYHTHIPVLLTETIQSLNIQPDGIYIDATFGCGGHTHAILSQLNRKGHLFAIDRDPIAVSIAKQINDIRFTIIPGLFSNIEQYMKDRNLIGKINGILFDLGMSSLQLDNPDRGFSFMHDGPLDMRMDNTQGKSAAEWLLRASVQDINWVLKNFGQERNAKYIAHTIVMFNKRKPITRTQELASLISKINPYFKHKHPATRSFQAIRIYINNEIKELQQALHGALSVLIPGGRISIISFHSLEDKLVKSFIYQYSHKLDPFIHLPMTEKYISSQKIYDHQLKMIDKKKPSTQEIKQNPRSRSSILRYAEKLK